MLKVAGECICKAKGHIITRECRKTNSIIAESIVSVGYHFIFCFRHSSKSSSGSSSSESEYSDEGYKGHRGRYGDQGNKGQGQ